MRQVGSSTPLTWSHSKSRCFIHNSLRFGQLFEPFTLQVRGWIECALCQYEDQESLRDTINLFVEDCVAGSAPQLYWAAWQIVVDVFLFTGDPACQIVGDAMGTMLYEACKTHLTLPISLFYPAAVKDLIIALHRPCTEASTVTQVTSAMQSALTAAADDSEASRYIWAIGMLNLRWQKRAALGGFEKEGLELISLLIMPFEREQRQNWVRSATSLGDELKRLIAQGGDLDGIRELIDSCYELCRPHQLLPTRMLMGLLHSFPHVGLLDHICRGVEHQVPSSSALSYLLALVLTDALEFIGQHQVVEDDSVADSEDSSPLRESIKRVFVQKVYLEWERRAICAHRLKHSFSPG